tara:strand:+ start:14340 stop:14570 length:231 start_codon:yes stop_codon:yes gene_type:complete
MAEGKKTPKNKPTSKKYKFYKIEGDKIVREKSCPRCGLGVFLMKANNRSYCGKCHYTEFITQEKKIEEKPKQEKKE